MLALAVHILKGLEGSDDKLGFEREGSTASLEKSSSWSRDTELRAI